MQVGAGRKIMNEPAIRKPAAASKVWGPKILAPMLIRCAAWFATVMFATLPVLAFAQPPSPGIHVKILSIRNTALEP